MSELEDRYIIGEAIITAGAEPDYPPIEECVKAGHRVWFDADHNPVSCDYGFCGRCGGHVDNGHQGHNWKFCQVTKTMRTFHFCCPNACELENADA